VIIAVSLVAGFVAMMVAAVLISRCMVRDMKAAAAAASVPS
jgi:hypothetical protein